MSTLIVVFSGIGLLLIFAYREWRWSRSCYFFKQDLDVEKEDLMLDITETLGELGIKFETNIEPHIQWNHVDGPLLHLSTAGVVWLSYKERFLLWISHITIDELNIKHCRKELTRLKRKKL